MVDVFHRKYNNTVEDVRIVDYLIRLYTIEWDSDQYGVIRKVVVVICATVLPKERKGGGKKDYLP